MFVLIFIGMRQIRLNEQQLRQVLYEAVMEILETRACLGVPYDSVRRLAHEVKEGDLDAIDRACLIMKTYVPVHSVLIPIPQHSGKAEYTLKMCQRLAQLCKSDVCDILSSTPREITLYKQKYAKTFDSKKSLGFQVQYDPNIEQKLKSTRNVILIDNVIDSGTTYNQAAEAIKYTYGVDAWLLTLGAVLEPFDKSQDVIRSAYPKHYRMHEALDLAVDSE